MEYVSDRCDSFACDGIGIPVLVGGDPALPYDPPPRQDLSGVRLSASPPAKMLRSDPQSGRSVRSFDRE